MSNEKQSDLVQGLKEHFNNTPPEQLAKEFDELEKWNQIGPDVLDYFKSIEQQRTMKEYDFSWLPKRLYIRTRVHTLQEGWDLCCAIMRKGYEGVKNESSRYNDLMLKSHFKQNGYCWVGILGSSLYILNTHDNVGRRKLKDLGKCKFIDEAGLEVRKEDMKRSKYLKDIEL